MKEQFDFTPMRKSDRSDRIDKINLVIEEYAEKGIRSLTLRQLFYQFLTRGWHLNNERSYILLCEAAKIGRLHGLIDWDAIEDRSRSLIDFATWSSPADSISEAAECYREDYWARQRYRPEVWIEKQALIGIIEDVVQDEYRAPLYTPRGYDSISQIYEAGKRFAEHIANGQTPIILHLGDHDPSGIHMSVDIKTRLSLFAGEDIEVRRLALNIDQVRKRKLDPNYAKMSDTRSPDYVRQFGKKCWELDALPPEVLVDLVRDGLQELIDDDEWESSKEHEASNCEKLNEMADDAR
jgi:hypothetical protein